MSIETHDLGRPDGLETSIWVWIVDPQSDSLVLSDDNSLVILMVTNGMIFRVRGCLLYALHDPMGMDQKMRNVTHLGEAYIK